MENRAEHGNEIVASGCLREQTRDFGQMIDIRLFRPAFSALIAVLAGSEIDGAHELDDVATRNVPIESHSTPPDAAPYFLIFPRSSATLRSKVLLSTKSVSASGQKSLVR